MLEFKWMLENGVMEDGQWHEPSTRYHGRVLAAFIPFAYALRRLGLMDAFNELPNFKKFVGWYRLVQTPPDTTMGGCALTPALSDGNWETVWEVTLGWAAGAYAQTDPTYAAELWSAWERACAPMGLEPSPPAHLASFLFIGCTRAGDCGTRFAAPFQAAPPLLPPVSSKNERQSAMLTGYAVLEQPSLASRPYMIVSTSTQRQTEGHEHPDRGSFSLYAHGTPIVLDPGVGWCGYQWFATIPAARANGTAFDKGLQYGAWYRGSQAHSMVNFAVEGAGIKPENETWRPAGAFGHEWGMRGAAWVDASLFTAALDYVDVNITRAVQASQQPEVRGYHRRVFANRRDDSYLVWDAVDAPESACRTATYNLHVVTQLGWPGTVGCTVGAARGGGGGAAGGVTRLECTGLKEIKLDVAVLWPADAVQRGLLHLEADPLPVQFTGTTGSAMAVPERGMPAVGGAFGGDWNAAGGLPPTDAHWLPRTPTWIRINAGEAAPTGPGIGAKAQPDVGNTTPPAGTPPCTGFLTLLQPRDVSTPRVDIELAEELPGGAVTALASTPGGATAYLLGSRASPATATGRRAGGGGDGGVYALRGVAGVVGWSFAASGAGAGALVFDHAELVQGNTLGVTVPGMSFRVVTSINVTLTIKSPAREQYVYLPACGPARVTHVPMAAHSERCWRHRICSQTCRE